MFKHQLKRVSKNIYPFIILGFISGMSIANSNYFESIEWLNWYLQYANIEINYKDSGQSVFFEHFAPNTLLYILIAIFFFSALHRTFRGAIEKPPQNDEGAIYALENFGSLLAISWLGLMIGIMGPAWYYEGFPSFIKFLVLAIYPIMFLVEVRLCTAFLYWEGLQKIPSYIDDRAGWRWGTRAEGAFVLLLCLIMLTFHQQYDSFMKLLGTLVVSLL